MGRRMRTFLHLVGSVAMLCLASRAGAQFELDDTTPLL